MEVSGPMFEPSESRFWASIFRRNGAHYNIFCVNDGTDRAVPATIEGMKSVFPDGVANKYNVVLFSTSGVHGMYTTIEEVEQRLPGEVTFLIIHPRTVTLRYGNVRVETKEDIEFLKKLRESSWAALQAIGRPE